ncbi:hypothetical protein FOCC_FOCC006338 [Frankliniella occidentalis]|nr:hypothetical protein FOCC_FOCC006338 [Frankliniella occidentalis]
MTLGFTRREQRTKEKESLIRGGYHAPFEYILRACLLRIRRRSQYRALKTSASRGTSSSWLCIPSEAPAHECLPQPPLFAPWWCCAEPCSSRCRRRRQPPTRAPSRTRTPIPGPSPWRCPATTPTARTRRAVATGTTTPTALRTATGCTAPAMRATRKATTPTPATAATAPAPWAAMGVATRTLPA